MGEEGNFPKIQQQRGAWCLVFTQGVLPGVASGQAGPLCGPNYLAQKRCHDGETGKSTVGVRRGSGERVSAVGRQGPVMVWQTDSERPQSHSLQKLLILPPSSKAPAAVASFQAQQTRPPR